MSKFISVVLILLSFVLVGCKSEPKIEVSEVEVTRIVTQIATQIVEQTVPVVETKIIEVPVTVVVTPTHTPGPTPTSTLTPTPTPTPTPFNVSSCIKLSLPIPKTENDDPWKTELPKYDGKCVQLIYEPFIKSKKGVVGFDYLLSFSVDFIRDELTPENVNKPTKYGYVWGIFEFDEGDPNLILRRVEDLPENQQSIWDEGYYTTGEDGEMAPGLWKSVAPPNWGGNCYWARLSFTNGDIIANHFGATGVTVRLRENEVFETNDNCTPWYYIGP